MAYGLDRAHVGNLERGVKNPTLATIWKITDALETRPSELLARAETLLDED